MQDLYDQVAKVVARWEKKTGKIIKYNFTVEKPKRKKKLYKHKKKSIIKT
jgi:hypothetical protein